MRVVRFEHSLGRGNIARVWFTKERGRILGFAIQLECLFGETWHLVVRYDTAHGFAHRDVMRPDGTTEKTELIVADYNEALTFAQNDIRANWQRYRARYEKWLGGGRRGGRKSS